MAGAPLSAEAFVASVLGAEIDGGAADFGYAMRLASGNPEPPGVIATTWIVARDARDRDRIRAHSKQNVSDFLDEPGFISIVTGFTGLRGFTVTAWTDEAAMRRALSGHHAAAMRELFEQDIVASVWTSVWTPARLNRLWLRCPACAALQAVDDGHTGCTTCGARLPARPAYW